MNRTASAGINSFWQYQAVIFLGLVVAAIQIGFMQAVLRDEPVDPGAVWAMGVAEAVCLALLEGAAMDLVLVWLARHSKRDLPDETEPSPARATVDVLPAGPYS